MSCRDWCRRVFELVDHSKRDVDHLQRLIKKAKGLEAKESFASFIIRGFLNSIPGSLRFQAVPCGIEPRSRTIQVGSARFPSSHMLSPSISDRSLL